MKSITFKNTIFPVTAILLLYCPLFAQLNYSTISDGSWSSASTWSGGDIPDYADFWNPATIRNVDILHDVNLTAGVDVEFAGYFHNITIDNGGSLTFSVNSLTVQDHYPSGTTNITVTDGNLIVNNDMIITNDGVLNIGPDGSAVINGNLTAEGSGGYINVASGGDLDVNGTITLQGSSSTLNSEGAVEADDIVVQGGSTNLNTSSTLTVNNDLTISGSGSMSIQSGTVNVGNDFINTGGAVSSVDGFLIVGNNVENNNTISGSGVIAWGGTWIPGGGSSVPFTPQGQAPAFNPFDLSNGQLFGGPLPIELLYFDAKVENHTVQLEWATEREENFDYFIIERAGNPLNFSAIGKVDGQGFSDKVTHYSFADASAAPGNNYYRLKAVDFDGSHEYFDPVLAKLGFENRFMVFPNPGDGKYLNLAIDDVTFRPQRIKIFNAKGNAVVDMKLEGFQDQISFYQALRSGVYFVSLEGHGEIYRTKWLID